jgi:DNA-binding transcriptional regulator YdaS (Cro superfamily)
MPKLSTEATALRALIVAHGSQRAAAKALGISEVYLSDLKHGRRPMSAKVLAKLGLQRIVVQRT